MVLPYVYKCIHKETGEFYIGSRCNNKESSDIDVLKYKTSSKYVKPIFDQFDVFIIAEFFSGVDAYDFEQQLIYENWKHPLSLNRSCFYGKPRWSHTGTKRSDETKLKISRAKIGIPHSAERKEKMSVAMKALPEHKGGRRKGSKSTPLSVETRLKISQTRKLRGYKQTSEITENLRQINRGRRWYTNGIINIKSRIPVDGFVLGLTPVRIYKKKNIMLIEQIKIDIALARKEHDTFKLGLLTTLLSDIQMIGKNALRESTDLEATSIVKKFIKGIDDTIALLTDSNEHKVMFDKLRQEKEILYKYLPIQLGDDELRYVILNAIDTRTCTTMPLLMKFLKDMYPGQYDGALASKIAKELLVA